MTFDPRRSAPSPTAKAVFEPWRSREVVWVKPHTNGRGEQEYVTRDGKTLPAERMTHEYEKVEDKASD